VGDLKFSEEGVEKLLEGSRRSEKVLEGSRRFQKVPEGSGEIGSLRSLDWGFREVFRFEEI